MKHGMRIQIITASICQPARGTFGAIVVAAVILGIHFHGSDAIAQQGQKVTKEQVIGTWTLVSVYSERPDGSKLEPLGPNPKGILIFTDNGRFAWQLTRPGLPKYASNDRLNATPEDYKTTVHGNLAYFGTYSINETDGMFVMHIEGSSYPNFEGQNQKRIVSLKGDDLKITNPTPAIGGTTAHVSWKRAK